MDNLTSFYSETVMLKQMLMHCIVTYLLLLR